MSQPIIPLKEFDQEMAATRRLIERVPSDRAEWKPHPKSFAIGHLTQLIAWMPGWIAETLRKPAIDIKGGGGGYSFENSETLVALFDTNAHEARTALTEVTGAALDEPWSLRMGDKVLHTQPRGEAARGHLNHLIHHRGQLTVYLRMLEVPLPQVYGPTADDRGFLKS